MPFITQGKTNLKYILIVVVLAVIVGGGILLFSREEAGSPEEGLPEIKSSIIFDNKTINQGDEFIITPSDDCVGDIKLKLIQVLSSSVVVDILEDERFDGKFYPRDEIERREIKTDTCIDAFPLCMDVWHEYCFEIGKSDSQITLDYKIKSESTMPPPPGEDETADWKTYSNEEYGYETSYPSDWKIAEAKPRVGDKVEWTGDILIGDEVQKVTFVEENYGFWPGSFEIRVLSNPDKLSIKDWWEKELKESDEWQKECLKENPSCPSLRDALISQEEMLFKNQVALKTSVFAFDHSQECIRTEKNHHIYTLCYDDSKANDDNYIKHSEIYHQIISTFKFLE